MLSSFLKGEVTQLSQHQVFEMEENRGDCSVSGQGGGVSKDTFPGGTDVHGVCTKKQRVLCIHLVITCLDLHFAVQ